MNCLPASRLGRAVAAAAAGSPGEYAQPNAIRALRGSAAGQLGQISRTEFVCSKGLPPPSAAARAGRLILQVEADELCLLLEGRGGLAARQAIHRSPTAQEEPQQERSAPQDAGQGKDA